MGREKKKVHLHIIVKPEIKKKLQELANKEGRNVSEILRELIIQKLKESGMM